MFLSLAMAKRYSELDAARERRAAEGARGPRLRGAATRSRCSRAWAPPPAIVARAGAGALHQTATAVAQLYPQPDAPVAGCASLLLYWIGRVWLLAHRGQMHDDPVVFALRDRVSLVLVLVTGAVLAAATLA